MESCPCAFRALSRVISHPVLCVPVSFLSSPFPFQSGFDKLFNNYNCYLITIYKCYLVCVVCPCAFRLLSRVISHPVVCPGVLPCLFPSLTEWPRLFFFPALSITWLGGARLFSLSLELLVNVSRALTFHPFLTLSHPGRSSSGFL